MMTNMSGRRGSMWSMVAIVACAFGSVTGCGTTETASPQRTFDSPDAAARALIGEVKKGNLDEVLAIFGPDGRALIDTSDPVMARRNQQVFTAAAAETWRLDAHGPATTTLVIGNEEWPFPIPLVKEGNAWRFDTAAGKEEVITRRIGRNELAAIRLCLTYVMAQRIYAQKGHDGEGAGLYAKTFRSDPNRHNGLYWTAARGEQHSPLGELVAHAAEEGTLSRQNGPQPSPFHGYLFRILTAQGPDAPGGAKDYLVDGKLARGFALVAWPAQYDVTGVMTFLVNHDGVVREKDLAATTNDAAQAMKTYNPDASWASVQ
jgi:Protein of unknown function (DUF2950)